MGKKNGKRISLHRGQTKKRISKGNQAHGWIVTSKGEASETEEEVTVDKKERMDRREKGKIGRGGGWVKGTAGSQYLGGREKRFIGWVFCLAKRILSEGRKNL